MQNKTLVNLDKITTKAYVFEKLIKKNIHLEEKLF